MELRGRDTTVYFVDLMLERTVRFLVGRLYNGKPFPIYRSMT